MEKLDDVPWDILAFAQAELDNIQRRNSHKVVALKKKNNLREIDTKYRFFSRCLLRGERGRSEAESSVDIVRTGSWEGII